MAGRAGGSVFLLTDYGLADEFAGVVRASVAAPCTRRSDHRPDARRDAVRRQGGRTGAGARRAAPRPRCRHGRRRPRRGDARAVPSRCRWPRCARRQAPRHFVGPDNGLLPWAADVLGGVDRAVEIRRLLRRTRRARRRAPTTFDGRDVFAPAAARLWQGAPLTELGPELDPAGLVRLTAPRVSVSPGCARGRGAVGGRLRQRAARRRARRRRRGDAGHRARGRSRHGAPSGADGCRPSRSSGRASSG